ncbi:MAG: hypothetical protein GY855_12260 [candidate division Zixibacteria bacterium]|nr:hypothetical protein [candidate division Zixibacteria bacterium]
MNSDKSNTSKIKAVSLYSGGLDSVLSAVIIASMGIDVTALVFSTPFCNMTNTGVPVDNYNPIFTKHDIKLKNVVYKKEYIDKVIKNPKHGFGSQANPCIDCHEFFFIKAFEYLNEIDGEFLITGEVVGQRPMSQMKQTLAMIDKETGLKGKILRPLSARLLPETDAEKDGMVDRSKLYAISGRGRKEQIALAKEYGITDYPEPAGGCLLTDPGIAARLKELIRFKPEYDSTDAMKLRVGRHFRINGIKIIIGRNEQDNDVIESLFDPNSEFLMEAPDFGSPLTLVEVAGDESVIETAARLTARYSDGKRENDVRVSIKHKSITEHVTVTPCGDSEYESKGINYRT